MLSVMTNHRQLAKQNKKGWESWEPRGVVWDIQIVFNALIVMMLELGVDGAIRCGAGWGA